MRLPVTILAAAMLASLPGCRKYSVECDLVVQPRVMVSAGSDPHTPAYMARVYVWYITEQEEIDESWAPASYADADAGIIRHRETGETRSFGLMAEQQSGKEDAADDYIHLVLTHSPAVLVAVDPVNRFYAWRTFEYPLPLRAPLYVPVTFRIYQPSGHEESEWTVVSEASEIKPGEKR